jgi:hypothetical protein
VEHSVTGVDVIAITRGRDWVRKETRGPLTIAPAKESMAMRMGAPRDGFLITGAGCDRWFVVRLDAAKAIALAKLLGEDESADRLLRASSQPDFCVDPRTDLMATAIARGLIRFRGFGKRKPARRRS